MQIFLKQAFRKNN
jgi:hypothetical protein